VLLVLFLVTAEPYWGLRLYRALEAAPDPGPVRRSLYRHTIVLEWVLAALTGLAEWRSALPWSHYGWTLPALGANPLVAGVGLGLIVGLGLSLVLASAARRSRGLRLRQVRIGEFSRLLPTTPAERRLFLATAITAGLAEEILYRGFLIPFLHPTLPLAGAVVVAAVIFGLGHLYQGWRGVAGTSLMGALFGVIFLATQSLFLVVILHMAMDVFGQEETDDLGMRKSPREVGIFCGEGQRVSAPSSGRAAYGSSHLRRPGDGRGAPAGQSWRPSSGHR
jgi:membrane protease YdiL (CAAX protease family)